MDYRKLLGKRIKELRKQKGLKQEQLAEIVNLEPASICNIENGYNYPSFQNLEKIITALDTTFVEVFEFEHHKNPDDLLFEINKMLHNNPDKIQETYKIIKAITE